ncbi:MAG: CBS domain-containing protein [Phycisphaerae bacterium]|nr:CBS domain-containing protein [Phycisphaerae bacterium]
MRGRSDPVVPHTVVTIRQGDRVTEAAKIMHVNGVGCLAVVDDTALMVGIVSERDILRWIGTGDPDSFSQRVGDIMTTNVVFCNAAVSLEQARYLMHRNGIRHLPIVENGRPVGMISARDLIAGAAPTAAEIA